MIQINIWVHYTVYSIQGVKTYSKDSTADTRGKWIGGPPKCTLASNIPNRFPSRGYHCLDISLFSSPCGRARLLSSLAESDAGCGAAVAALMGCLPKKGRPVFFSGRGANGTKKSWSPGEFHFEHVSV